MMDFMCGIRAASFASGVSESSLLKAIGHDGTELIPVVTYDNADKIRMEHKSIPKAFTIYEIAYALASMGRLSLHLDFEIGRVPKNRLDWSKLTGVLVLENHAVGLRRGFEWNEWNGSDDYIDRCVEALLW